MAHAHPTVLLVDDHADSRDALSHLLRDAGYAVAEASNGRVALDTLHAGLRPCIIVSDLIMPEMSGFEFRQEQLRDAALAHIPFVVYSAITDAPRSAAHLKPTAALRKPVEAAELVECVRTHCLK